MAAKKPTVFTVEGTYPFPVDMLRYDACWPVSTEDAVQLGEACNYGRRVRPENTIRRVKLMTNAENRPTVGRWASFGWTVK